MTDVFISYASEDMAQAQRLAQALEGQGWSVWWDRDIPPGMDYATVIENAVKASRCVVVLWSQHSIASRWVQNEAAEGAERKILLPAFIESVDIPFEFRRLQAADLTPWLSDTDNIGFNQLVASVGRILNSPSTPLPKKTQKQKQESPSAGLPTSWGAGKKLWFRLGGVAALLIGLTSCSEALTWGDGEMAMGSLILMVVGGVLLYRSTKL